jgi:phage terminase Nu1 subunit (DNA packaging protein)
LLRIRETTTIARMTAADFELTSDGSVKMNGHGGARRGAGRKPADYVKPKEVLDFEQARARNEASKADLNELDFKIKSGQYVSRDAVKKASATMLATLAQSLRSIPDALERKGLSPEMCVLIENVINETLDSAASELEMLAGEPA